MIEFTPVLKGTSCGRWKQSGPINSIRADQQRLAAEERAVKDAEIEDQLAILRRLVPDVTPAELRVSGDLVLSLPTERAWMSPLGMGMIGITSIRRGTSGVIEFQLADESGTPYADGTEWRPATAFGEEYPQ